MSLRIHDNHALITRQTRDVVTIADDLEHLVTEAEALGPLSADAATRTGASPSTPGLVGVLTGRAVRASGIADRLESNVDDVTGKLRGIGTGLSDVSTHLEPLAPRAAALADVLRRIARETAPLRPIGSIMGTLGRWPPHLRPRRGGYR